VQDRASAGNAVADYAQLLDEGGLRGARIGVARNFTGSEPGVYALFDEAVEAMRGAGAVIVDETDLEPDRYDNELQLVTLTYEFRANLNAYLAGLGPDAPVRTLADVIAFNERNAEREMPHFGQELMIASEERGPLADPEYLEAFETIRGASRADVDGPLREHELDAIVAPSTPLAWPTDHVKGDRLDGAHSAGPAAIAGYPSLTVPMGYVSGLPVGITFFAGAWSEPTLLRVAYAYEQATNHRRAPTFPETVG
jgi:amidase